MMGVTVETTVYHLPKSAVEMFNRQPENNRHSFALANRWTVEIAAFDPEDGQVYWDAFVVLPTRPTKRQIRQLKKQLLREMRGEY